MGTEGETGKPREEKKKAGNESQEEEGKAERTEAIGHPERDRDGYGHGAGRSCAAEGFDLPLGVLTLLGLCRVCWRPLLRSEAEGEGEGSKVTSEDEAGEGYAEAAAGIEASQKQEPQPRLELAKMYSMCVPLSSRSTAAQVQGTIETKLPQINQGLFGPPGKREGEATPLHSRPPSRLSTPSVLLLP